MNDRNAGGKRSLGCNWSWGLPIRILAVVLISAGLFAVCDMVAASTQAAQADSDRLKALSLLAEVKTALGGRRWDSIAVISAEGSKSSYGMHGKYRSIDQLSNGFFLRRAEYPLFLNAEGLDGMGRWRQDNSGLLHPLDSDEAIAVAVTESYIARRGFLFPERIQTQFGTESDAVEGGRHVKRVRITPRGGREFTLSIDDVSRLPRQAVFQLSVHVETVTFDDYRSVDGLLLPHQVSIEHGDEAENGTATISVYAVGANAAAPLVRPAANISDVAWPADKRETIARACLDPNSGFFVVDAMLNGQGPFPFILDTGGHNILSPAIADLLKLDVAGKGFSTGAGAGSTPTQFTKVTALRVGAVAVSNQPFLVLHIDFGAASCSGEKPRRIAGLLGLELYERFAITTDYRAGSVLLRPLLAAGEKAQAIKLPIRFTSDMPLVRASLNGRSGWFAVDSGNNVEVIVFRNWAQTNDLSPEVVASQSARGMSVGGDLRFQHGRALSFKLGPVDLGAIDILFAQDKQGSLSARYEAGNIGNSVLKNFRVTVDYADGAIYLERQ